MKQIPTFSRSDIKETKAADLEIKDKEKYCYIMTYSFPCTDLSRAGRVKGMEKGAGTRSGLLWEVERLLDECEELPQVLLMENVPEVIGARNKKPFGEWLNKLDRLGYRSYWEILNSRDYGVPQNRARCIMVSILGDYYFEFPRSQKLTKKASDYFYNANLQDEIISPQSKSKELIIYADQNTAKIKQATKKGYIELKNNGVVALAFPTSTGRRGRVIGGGDVCPTLTCATSEIYKFIDGEFYRINNLEKFRLMGFDDDDYYSILANGLTNTEINKQAGNSIVVNVLMSVFAQMF